MTGPQTRMVTGIDVALLVLLAALWGSSYAFVKIALDSITPLTLTGARVLIAALTLAAVLAVRRLRPPASRHYWARLGVQSMINIAGPFALYAWAQQYAPSALAGIINGSTPIFVCLITALWTRHERLDMERVIGTGVGLAGVLAIVGLAALAGIGQHMLAVAAMLLGTLGYAGSAVHGRRFHGVPAVVTAAGALGLSVLVTVPLAFLVEDPLALSPSTGAVLSVLYLGIGCTGATFVLYFHLVDRIGSMNTVSASYLRAGFAVLFGIVLLGEPLSWSIAVGLVGVMVGVAAINGQFARLAAWVRRRA